MVRLDNVSKLYRTPQGDVRSLDAVSLQVNAGEFVVIRGPSGCGKTTLLLTIGAMLRPTSGQVTIQNSNLYELSARARASFRARSIGFVFQMFHLVPYLTVRENVLLSDWGSASTTQQSRADQLIGELGLSARAHHIPAKLSTGERQRAAIARALLHQPRVILADEPTGNLDPDNAGEVFRHLKAFHRNGGTLIVVTHGSVENLGADRIVNLKAGKVDNE
jgi:putative ABC transport system ATP-binding protein